MDQLQSTTTQRKKGQHLTFEERVLIQTRLKDGYSKRAIAREIGCSPATICNEMKRGTVPLYTGNVFRYKASVGQKTIAKRAADTLIALKSQLSSNMLSGISSRITGPWMPAPDEP